MRDLREIEKFTYAFDSGRAVGDAEGHRRGHLEGYDAGLAEGRAQRDAELEAERAAWLSEANGALVADLTSRPDYATLCELRGEHHRAARHRALLSERGIA